MSTGAIAFMLLMLLLMTIGVWAAVGAWWKDGRP